MVPTWSVPSYSTAPGDSQSSGGGSCTTWVAGKIVNNPSQGRERPTANALVVVRRNKK